MLEVAEDTVTLAPLAVSAPLWFELVPTETVPKDNDTGDAVNCPGLAPAPDRATERLASVAVDERLRAPLAAPADIAVKPMLIVMLCPAARVWGLNPLTLNPFPLTAA